MVDPEKIISNWPKSLWKEGLTKEQSDGIKVLCEAWKLCGDDDKRKLAYLLATSWHETARTMQPIEEYGKGKKKPYGKPDQETGNCFYGRGYVMLTWKENYLRLSKIVKEDLVRHPELATNPDIAAKIAVKGMMMGLFSGKKLSDYFTPNRTDWYNARRVINVLDKATEIAEYAKAIYEVIKS